MKKILIFMMFSFFCSSVFAQTFSSRYGTEVYYLGDYAIHTIYTNPIKPNQPVYSWRTHTNFNGTPGIHTHNGTQIGHTNSAGVLSIVVGKLPYNSVHCGWIRNERVAVGSRSAPKSNRLNFTITKKWWDLPSPRPPYDPLCSDPSNPPPPPCPSPYLCP